MCDLASEVRALETRVNAIEEVYMPDHIDDDPPGFVFEQLKDLRFHVSNLSGAVFAINQTLMDINSRLDTLDITTVKKRKPAQPKGRFDAKQSTITKKSARGGKNKSR